MLELQLKHSRSVAPRDPSLSSRFALHLDQALPAGLLYVASAKSPLSAMFVK